MILFADSPKIYSRFFLAALTAFSVVSLSAPPVQARTVAAGQTRGNLGIIKGMVRDGGGSPIANAYVSFFRVGTSKLLKQIRSAADGSFFTKIIPGTYTVLAVAEGYNPMSVADVEVNRAAELIYGFKLERAGNGNTLPEKRVDRSSTKWTIRAAQSQRSIYQNQTGSAPIDENRTAQNEPEAEVAAADRENEPNGRQAQTIVETYFTNSADGGFTNINFATLLPVGANTEIIFAGQTDTGGHAPRFETNLKFQPSENHQIRLKTSIGNLGKIKSAVEQKSLGQVSFQGFDEWQIKKGVILVLGFDYSRFIGAGNDFSLTPRFGLQFDLNAKTRVRTAFAAKPEDKNWANAAELENTSIAFNEPVAVEDLTVVQGKPKLNKSRRLEFGIERVLDNKSSVEANAFFDTTSERGVGLMSLPFNFSNNGVFNRLSGSQQGGARGLRVVYARRLNGIFSTSAGYAFGSGQKLSARAISNPSELFENDFFQSFYGEVNADLKTGTRIKTVFRLSPQATVFAIDPFQGRLAIYDPGLSVLVTQNLPNLGLPFRAEAIMDARNLFDFQTNVGSSEGSLQLNSQRRSLRGGILVRF